MLNKYVELKLIIKNSEKYDIIEWFKSYGHSIEYSVICSNYYNDLRKSNHKTLSQFAVGEKVKSKLYSNWVISEKIGTFGSGFRPDLTPEMMLRLGVFDGEYINDWIDEIPLEWIMMTLLEKKLNIFNSSNKNYNFYGVSSLQDMDHWVSKGWVREQDPKGWFQWYIRYYLGRRSEDDDRQIARWISFKRHVYQIKANKGKSRLKQRQACIQWGYNPDM